MREAFAGERSRANCSRRLTSQQWFFLKLPTAPAPSAAAQRAALRALNRYLGHNATHGFHRPCREADAHTLAILLPTATLASYHITAPETVRVVVPPAAWCNLKRCAS